MGGVDRGAWASGGGRPHGGGPAGDVDTGRVEGAAGSWQMVPEGRQRARKGLWEAETRR